MRITSSERGQEEEVDYKNYLIRKRAGGRRKRYTIRITSSERGQKEGGRGRL